MFDYIQQGKIELQMKCDSAADDKQIFEENRK